ncbi:MAG: FAD-dependent oxidoreductase [Tissierellia bacterium]|nr:FAD-dependent oxidoreductase [Tissierellia bacterium]
MYDCIIVGGGPAGMTAAIYAARAGMKTGIIEKLNTLGGAMYKTSRIDNYPGFETGSTGPEITSAMEKQVKEFDIDIINDRVIGLNLNDKVKKVFCIDKEIETKSLILAMGVSQSVEESVLKVPGEKEFAGRGISYCGTCDAPFFRNMHIYVIGNKDEAAEEAIYLSDFGKKVTIITNKEKMNISDYFEKSIKEIDNIEIWNNKKVLEFKGNGILEEFVIEDRNTKEQINIKPDEGDFAMGVFIFAGKPNSTNFIDNIVDLENGSIITDEFMQTNIDGVFAAGDVRKKNLRQIVTATSDGAIAAMNARKYIKNNF